MYSAIDNKNNNTIYSSSETSHDKVFNFVHLNISTGIQLLKRSSRLCSLLGVKKGNLLDFDKVLLRYTQNVLC